MKKSDVWTIVRLISAIVGLCYVVQFYRTQAELRQVKEELAREKARTQLVVPAQK